MRELLNYNFNPEDIKDEEYKLLFEKRRRDSTFALVYKKNGFYYAIRDHLGIVPLYYRRIENEFKFSTNLSDLVLSNDEIDKTGLQFLLAFGTPRLFPLIKGINIIAPGAVVELNKATGKTRTLYQYKIKPGKISFLKNMNSIVNEVDFLFYKAVKRLIKFDSVGLYLSGGMDSSLIGIYLKMLGIKVNAYTSASEGINSDEAKNSKRNAEFIGVQNHFIDTIEYKNYSELFPLIAQIYGIPHGTTLSIGVGSLWKNTPIKNEQQIFFGQNSDTMTCSVGIQVRMYFRQFLPKFIKKKGKVEYHGKLYELPDDEILHNYIYLRSKGLVNEYPQIYNVCEISNITNLQLLTIAGMYFGHTPNDSEDMSQPAINRNIIISNPYYDMDLIEYILGIPIRHRLSFIIKRKYTKIYPIFKKRVIQKLALKYLPEELVLKKKGFIVSLRKFDEDMDFTDNLPSTILGNPLENVQSKVTAGVFASWCEINKIKLPYIKKRVDL